MASHVQLPVHNNTVVIFTARSMSCY